MDSQNMAIFSFAIEEIFMMPQFEKKSSKVAFIIFMLFFYLLAFFLARVALRYGVIRFRLC